MYKNILPFYKSISAWCYYCREFTSTNAMICEETSLICFIEYAEALDNI